MRGRKDRLKVSVVGRLGKNSPFKALYAKGGPHAKPLYCDGGHDHALNCHASRWDVYVNCYRPWRSTDYDN